MTTTLTNGDKSITVWCKCSIAVSNGGGTSRLWMSSRVRLRGAIGRVRAAGRGRC